MAGLQLSRCLHPARPLHACGPCPQEAPTHLRTRPTALVMSHSGPAHTSSSRRRLVIGEPWPSKTSRHSLLLPVSSPSSFKLCSRSDTDFFSLPCSPLPASNGHHPPLQTRRLLSEFSGPSSTLPHPACLSWVFKARSFCKWALRVPVGSCLLPGCLFCPERLPLDKRYLLPLAPSLLTPLAPQHLPLHFQQGFPPFIAPFTSASIPGLK